LPKKSKKKSNNQERRVTDQLLKHWKKLKGKRPYPSLADIHPADIKDIWADCFMVEIDDNHRHHYTYLGENICDMLGGDLTGTSVLYLSDNLASKYFGVVEKKKPLVDESEFINLKNNEVKYRQILLPVGPDKKTVDHVLGAMRYKQDDEED